MNSTTLYVIEKPDTVRRQPREKRTRTRRTRRRVITGRILGDDKQKEIVDTWMEWMNDPDLFDSEKKNSLLGHIVDKIRDASSTEEAKKSLNDELKSVFEENIFNFGLELDDVEKYQGYEGYPTYE